MNQKKKNIIILCLYLLSYCINGCNNKEQRINEKVVGSINGEKIFFHEVESEFNDFMKKFNTKKPLTNSEKENLMKNILNTLIEKKLLFQEIERLHITVTEEELDNNLQNILGDYPSLRLKEVLERNEMTFQRWKKKMEQNIAIEKLINREVNKKIIITEKEMEEYYKTFPDEFLQPLHVHALQIVVETESEARSIRKKLLKGADFAETAKAKSFSPESKKGGDLGFFSKGQMPREFDDIVFTLPIGEISDVIQTPYGYHIFTVLEKKKSQQIDFQEAKKKIKKILTEQKQKTIFSNWMKQLKNNSVIVMEKNVASG